MQLKSSWTTWLSFDGEAVHNFAELLFCFVFCLQKLSTKVDYAVLAKLFDTDVRSPKLIAQYELGFTFPERTHAETGVFLLARTLFVICQSGLDWFSSEP